MLCYLFTVDVLAGVTAFLDDDDDDDSIRHIGLTYKGRRHHHRYRVRHRHRHRHRLPRCTIKMIFS